MRDLTWLGWLWVILVVIAIVLRPLAIGRPRKPLTAAEVITMNLMAAGWLYGVLTVGLTR